MVDTYRDELAAAITDGESEQAAELTRAALAAGADPLAIIQQIMVPTLTAVGERFQAFEIFLPELMMAGEAAATATALLEEAIEAAGGERPNLGTVVLGTVEGDIHDIGKNIVGTILKSHGFNVIDLGRDISPARFIEEAERHRAVIIAMSSLMTTTRPAQRNTINLLSELGQRGQYRVIVGGGCVTADWASDIGADGFAENAAQTAVLCKTLVAE
jgi:corrinoid protein of di/trimethylamine methyltransferase